MDLNLFFSDGTKEYRNPVDIKAGDNVTVRFRVPAGCPIAPVLHMERGCICMRLAEAGTVFDYYKGTIPVGYLQ